MNSVENPIIELSKEYSSRVLKRRNDLKLWTRQDVDSILERFNMQLIFNSENYGKSYYGNPDGLIMGIDNNNQNMIMVCASANITSQWVHGGIDQIHTTEQGFVLKTISFEFKNHVDGANTWANLANRMNNPYDFLPLNEWTPSVFENFQESIMYWGQDEDFFDFLQNNLAALSLNSETIQTLRPSLDAGFSFENKDFIPLKETVRVCIFNTFPDLFWNEKEVNPKKNQRKTIKKIYNALMDENDGWQKLTVALEKQQTPVSALNIYMRCGHIINDSALQQFEDWEKHHLCKNIRDWVKNTPVETIKLILKSDSFLNGCLKHFLAVKPTQEFSELIKSLKTRPDFNLDDFKLFSLDLTEDSEQNNFINHFIGTGLSLNNKQEKILSTFFKENQDLFIDNQNNKTFEFDVFFKGLEKSQTNTDFDGSYCVLKKELDEIEIQKSLKNHSNPKPNHPRF